jgi:hypothetical protein
LNLCAQRCNRKQQSHAGEHWKERLCERLHRGDGNASSLFHTQLQSRSPVGDYLSQSRPAGEELLFVCDRSITSSGNRHLIPRGQTSEHGPGCGVFTIVLLKRQDGIVDFHDFFVQSYWRFPAIHCGNSRVIRLLMQTRLRADDRHTLFPSGPSAKQQRRNWGLFQLRVLPAAASISAKTDVSDAVIRPCAV